MRNEVAYFEADVKNVEHLREFVQQFMERARLSHEQIYNFQIAVDEHFINLVEHAFQGNSRQKVSISCLEDDKKTQVTIVDSSKGFDPRTFSIPDVEGTPLDEISPGGFGNYFIYELIDDVEYIHRPHLKNELILTMYKR